MALHMYFLVRCIWSFLANRFGCRWFVVYEYVMKTEYQGRGTPHWHIAAWVVCFGLLAHLQGRTGTAVLSAFAKLLALLFHCEVDVQVGTILNTVSCKKKLPFLCHSSSYPVCLEHGVFMAKRLCRMMKHQLHSLLKLMMHHQLTCCSTWPLPHSSSSLGGQHTGRVCQ